MRAGDGTSGREAREAELPPALRRIAPERIVDLDVRDDLRQGREPFGRIMAARRALPEGGVLLLRAIFEPVPLYTVLAKQGLAHWTEKVAADDWRVWFYPTGTPADRAADPAPAPAPDDGAADPAPAPAPSRDAPGDAVVVLDVRGLEPPEPMARTLEAAERLPTGATLVQINARVPRFLLPQLEARGFTYEVREQESDLVRIFIRRRADA